MALNALERYIADKGKEEVVRRMTPIHEPDAELLRLNTEYRTLMGEIDASRHNDAEGDVSDEAQERMSALEHKIANTPAETYAGIGIKLLIGVDNLDPLDPGEPRTTDLLNLESALADAERLAGATSSTVVPETTGEDPFEALAAEWAEQKAECKRLSKAEDEASDTTELAVQSNAAGDRLGEIEKRIAVTPTTTILGIAIKLRAEVFAEVEYEFTTTEHVIKTALAGAESLLARSQEGEAGLLALEAEIVKEHADWKAGRVKDDEADGWGDRVAEMEKRFAEMSAHTLSGAAAKLRQLRRLLVDDGTVRTHDIPLVETSLAAVEQANKAGRAT